MLPGDTLGDSNALFLCFVRQHWTTHHIADCPDIRQIRFAMIIHHDEAALIEFQTNGIGMESVGIRYTTNRDNQLINLEHLRCAAGIGVLNTHPFAGFDFADLHAHLNGQTLLDEQLMRFAGD